MNVNVEDDGTLVLRIPKQEQSVQIYLLECLKRVTLSRAGVDVINGYIEEIKDRYSNVEVLR